MKCHPFRFLPSSQFRPFRSRRVARCSSFHSLLATASGSQIDETVPVQRHVLTLLMNFVESRPLRDFIIFYSKFRVNISSQFLTVPWQAIVYWNICSIRNSWYYIRSSKSNFSIKAKFNKTEILKSEIIFVYSTYARKGFWKHRELCPTFWKILYYPRVRK